MNKRAKSQLRGNRMVATATTQRARTQTATTTPPTYTPRHSQNENTQAPSRNRMSQATGGGKTRWIECYRDWLERVGSHEVLRSAVGFRGSMRNKHLRPVIITFWQGHTPMVARYPIPVIRTPWQRDTPMAATYPIRDMITLWQRYRPMALGTNVDEC